MTSRKRSNQLAVRFAVFGVAMITFLGSAVLNWQHKATFHAILRLWGVPPPTTFPFLDLRYLLAVTECWQKGANVYIFDPCDPAGRLFGYSPIWLRLSFLPTQHWAIFLGISVDILFLIVLAAFPPPKTAREALTFFFAILSPPVVLALQRANVDVMIFIMLVGAAAMWGGRLLHRIATYSIIFMAGSLKFYPFILLTLAVRERARISLATFAVSGIFLLALAGVFFRELVEMWPNIPRGGYFTGTMFGAKNLPNGILFVLGLGPRSPLVALMWIVLLSGFAVQVFNLVRWDGLRRELNGEDHFARNLFLFGAAIISGCFFAGQSEGYRGIFLLLLLPWLFMVWRQASDSSVRRFGRQVALVVLFLLWQGALTWNEIFLRTLRVWFGSNVGSTMWIGLWVAREIAWWFVVATVVGIFLSFVADSRTFLWLNFVQTSPSRGDHTSQSSGSA